MNPQAMLNKLDFRLPELKYQEIEKKVKEIKKELIKELKDEHVIASVFVGGSFAKKTMLNQERLDVDIFVRFDKKERMAEKILEKVVKRVSKNYKLKHRKIHGSRDYYKIEEGNLAFEIVPVLKIRSPKEARNVTDLSYFHVGYVKEKTKSKKVQREIALIKQFCKAQGVYGAESYIQGFSGYAVECLGIYYGSFVKLCKAIATSKEKIFIDPAKHYPKKSDLLVEINESKLAGPIVLVDPTCKERNILAAVSNETFEKFKEKTKEFIKSPSIKYFEKVRLDKAFAKKKAEEINADLTHLKISTNRQEGDIAGTKIRKVERFIEKEVEREFNLIESLSEITGEKETDVYLLTKPLDRKVQVGPPIEMVKHVEEFRKKHEACWVEDGRLKADVKPEKEIASWLTMWIKENEKRLDESGPITVTLVTD